MMVEGLPALPFPADVPLATRTRAVPAGGVAIAARLSAPLPDPSALWAGIGLADAVATAGPAVPDPCVLQAVGHLTSARHFTDSPAVRWTVHRLVTIPLATPTYAPHVLVHGRVHEVRLTVREKAFATPVAVRDALTGMGWEVRLLARTATNVRVPERPKVSLAQYVLIGRWLPGTGPVSAVDPCLFDRPAVLPAGAFSSSAGEEA